MGKEVWSIFIAAGSLAAILALVLNQFCYRRLGPGIIVSLVPFWEEGLKTGLAWLLDASLIWTHGVFGVLECLWDWFQPGKGHWLPALVGLLFHLVLGILTQWIFLNTGLLLLAVLAAGLVHAIWNWFMQVVEHKLKNM